MKKKKLKPVGKIIDCSFTDDDKATERIDNVDSGIVRSFLLNF